jgi:hypothetical protein
MVDPILGNVQSAMSFILYVYAKDEEATAEMEDNLALHISIIATDILKREVSIVLVLPKQMT